MATEHPRILIVDDEPQIVRVLRRTFGSHGFDVRTAADADAALDLVKDWNPDLVITDLAMPGVDGLELCRLIRARATIPIIVLSVRGDERVKVAALDAGADDYVTKPFGMDELLARVRSALRRASTPPSSVVTRIDTGDFALDLDARVVRVRGQAVHLTPKEYDLLVHLARHPDRVLTHRALLGAVWGGEATEQTEYLRVFIGQLRKKIEPDPSTPRYLITEPWVGYRFVPSGT